MKGKIKYINAKNDTQLNEDFVKKVLEVEDCIYSFIQKNMTKPIYISRLSEAIVRKQMR